VVARGKRPRDGSTARVPCQRSMG